MKEQQAKPELRRLLSWGLMLMPVVLLLTFVGLAAHVRLGLGHWPMPMEENYRTAAYDIHEQLFFLVALFTVYVAVPLWFVTLCFPALRVSWRVHLIQAAVYVGGWGLVGIYTAIDPGRFAEWFLD